MQENADPDAGGSLSATADEGSVVITDSRGGEVASSGTATPRISSGPVFEYRRLPAWICGTLAPVSTGAECLDGVESRPRVNTCADGSVALDPMFRREVDAVTSLPLDGWEQVDDGWCPGDVADAVVVSVEEFRRLPLIASIPHYQPPDGRGLVNKDLIVYADPAPQTLATTVLGVPVTVRASPVQFAWDFGDGSDPLVTTDPGAPYPDHTVSYPYREPGQFAVRLVTTWQGQYQVNGAGSWYPVAGTAATSSAPFTAQVFEAHAHLVADDLG